jgi:capsule polysaccharide modification protein KpsS
MLDRFEGKNVLLLQGPIGPFFRRLARDLEARGCRVTKVALNAGDALYYLGTGHVPYRGSFEKWPAFVERLIREREIDTVFALGDMRPYHRALRPVFEEAGVESYFFEEGYLRPDFITLEAGGVNGNSPMPREIEPYLEADLAPIEDVSAPSRAFAKSGWLTAAYYTAFNFLCFLYPRYRHYRDSNVFKHAFSWVRGAFRKIVYARRESHLLPLFEGELSKKYFFVPLQVWNDFQWKHSKINSIEEFVERVLQSFARHADEDHKLVIKHHPADRAYRDYSGLIAAKVAEHGLGGRVFYVFDLHLPTLLRNALGTVVLNSTVGLSSVHHATPVKALGRAVYRVSPITFEGRLRDFWTAGIEFDYEIYLKFRGWMEHHNQFNGNFYARIPGTDYATGVRWDRAEE